MLAVLPGVLVPVDHIAVVEPPPPGGSYWVVTRLCRPEDPVPWDPLTLPVTAPVELEAASTAPSTCRVCADRYQRPDRSPVAVSTTDSDDLSTPSLLSLL
ncbi:hypothetical protein B6G06_09215 [Actinomyces gaoshouyii]|nr:hypothetical protein B6G06_09215 [Actinomyces gaoshouyii]